MIKLHRLPAAMIALGAATPAFAHEADFFHTHGESMMIGAAVLAAAAGGLALRAVAKRARK